MASSSSSSKRPSFSADDGLASIAEFSGAGSHLYPFVSRIGSYTASLRAASPRSGPGRAFYTRFEEPHFLQSCSLCKKPLGSNRDIFMYRGDMPFCSEECREEQMEMDDAMEKTRSFSASKKAMRTQQESSSRGKSQKYPLRPGITAA